MTTVLVPPPKGAGSADNADVERAIAAISAGSLVVVVDDGLRGHTGNMVFAAAKATPELVAFALRHSSGLVWVALPEADCDRLGIPSRHHSDRGRFGAGQLVSVDAADGITAGISPIGRAHTIRVLASAEATAGDLCRPGHVVPIRTTEGGVLSRAGLAEAAVDLTRLAGLRPAGVRCEIASQSDAWEPAGRAEIEQLAAAHQLPVMMISDLLAYRRHAERRAADR